MSVTAPTSYSAISAFGLAGIHEIQLMEQATRNFSKKCVSGLSKCIERDLSLGAAERQTWKETNERGLDSFGVQRGESYQAFDSRSRRISPSIIHMNSNSCPSCGCTTDLNFLRYGQIQQAIKERVVFVADEELYRKEGG